MKQAIAKSEGEEWELSSQDDLKSLKQTLDFPDVEAVLFGLQALLAPWSSDAKAVYSTIRQIRTMLETDVVGKISEGVSKGRVMYE